MTNPTNTPGERRRLDGGRVSYAGRAVTVYFDTEADKDAAEAAYRAWGGLEGYASRSDWMADIIMREVRALETKHGMSVADIPLPKTTRKRH